MKIGEEIFVIDVCSKDDDWYYNKELKQAYMLKLKGKIIEIKNDNEIRYSFGHNVKSGQIGYDCFLTKEDAEERINGLNNYFQENGYLLND